LNIHSKSEICQASEASAMAMAATLAQQQLMAKMKGHFHATRATGIQNRFK
jgi:hypothetical protein